MKEKFIRITLLFLMLVCVGNVLADNTDTTPKVQVVTTKDIEPGYVYYGQCGITVYYGDMVTESQTHKYIMYYSVDNIDVRLDNGTGYAFPTYGEDFEKAITNGVRNKYPNAKNIVVDIYVNAKYSMNKK